MNIDLKESKVSNLDIGLLSSLEGIVTIMFPMVADVNDYPHKKVDDIDNKDNPTYIYENNFVSTNFDFILYNDKDFLEKSRVISMMLSKQIFNFEHIENIVSVTNLIPYVKPKINFEKNVHLYSQSGEKYAIIDKRGRIKFLDEYIFGDAVLFGELFRILSIATKEKSDKRDGQLILKYGRNVLYTYKDKYYSTFDDVDVKDLVLSISSILFRGFLLNRVKEYENILLGQGDLQLIMIMDSIAFQISNILRLIDENLYKIFIRNRVLVEKLGSDNI